MTTQSHEGTAASPHTPPPGGEGGTDRRTARRRPNLGLDRFSGLYVWIVVIALFALWIPDTFMTQGNFRIIAGDQAITAMLAIGLIVPLAAGVFDLSIAGIMGFSVAMVSYQLSQGVSTPIAVVTTLLCGALIGAVNGFVVVKLKVDSFIATLGMSSILLAGTYWVTDGKQITEGFTDGFLDLGSKPFLGLPLPFFYMIGVAAVMYVVLEKTPLGRYFYATGGNRQAARLAGLRVERIMFGALMTSATIAAFTRSCPGSQARHRRARHRPVVPVAGVLGRLPRLDSDTRRSGQRPGHTDRHLSACHRREGTAVGRCSQLRQRPLQRTRPHRRRGSRGPDRPPYLNSPPPER
ncbi:MAG: hypothetical protein U5N21_19495 [Rhodococcus sp. (in: high G+C Gram-positive bacteria)]|nr:hypothetical protein [Rhodococcus sp. (in: high G+C Gram-positive bacteria)]